jgi:hypothetical protein
LNASRSLIRNFILCRPIIDHFDRKATPPIGQYSNFLDHFTPGPKPNFTKAILHQDSPNNSDSMKKRAHQLDIRSLIRCVCPAQVGEFTPSQTFRADPQALRNRRFLGALVCCPAPASNAKLTLQNVRWKSIHSAAFASASRLRWHVPCLLRRSLLTINASSNTLRCLKVAGSEIPSGLASSTTVASPRTRRATIARRLACERAANVRSRFIIQPTFNFVAADVLRARRNIIASSS